MISNFNPKFIYSPMEDQEFPKEAENLVNSRPAYFRRAFEIKKSVKNATLFVTALGVYETGVDGKRLGDELFAPGFTDYNKRIYYSSYDITEELTVGKHVIHAIVADGWFCGRLLDVGCRQYGDHPYLAARLDITYDDGAWETFETDEDWKSGTGGLLYSDIQTGEYFDKTEEVNGWDSPDFDDSGWQNSIRENPCHGARVLPAVIHVRKMLRQPLCSVLRDKSGNFIYDMGQNMAGTVTFRAKAKRGEKLILRHGEMLSDDGTLYTDNLRTARQTDVYVFGSDNEEEYTPRFTFHGFRYVESNLELLHIEGNVIYTDCRESGFVNTSHQTVNKIFQNQLWSQRGNFLSIPTDCPQRDERMGWTGDAQVFAKSACYNMDSYEFYMKYLADIRDAQLPSGSIPCLVPNVRKQNKVYRVGSGVAAWGDAIFIIPWHLYTIYGKTEPLIQNYEAMEAYLNYLLDTSDDFIRPKEGFGDWLSADEVTPQDVLATAFLAYDARLMAQISGVLGKDSSKYNQYYKLIKKAFNEKFTVPDGRIKGDTQTCYLMAVKFGLTDDIEKTKSHLVRTIERRNNHLSTGFVGISYLLPVLCDLGLSKLAYTILLNETYPSWGYSIKNGATTIWERWNSYTIEQGFANNGMNSFNHYSLGSVAEWMYEYMGGIKPAGEGFSQIVIKPYMDKRVDKADIKYLSTKGEIHVSYCHSEKKMEVSIPDCIKARIYAPLNAKAEGFSGKHERDHTVFFVEGGKHQFVW